jgi:outer membrane immunogenic protein
MPGMRKRVRIGIAVALAFAGSRAFAADLIPPPPAVSPNLQIKAPVLAPPTSSWSGPYAGVEVGTRYDAVDANVTSATFGTPPVAIPLPVVSQGDSNSLFFWQQNQSAMQYLDNIAFRAGFYAGWNFQIAPTYVVGGEVDFAFANETATFHGSPYPVNLQFGSPSLVLGGSFKDTYSFQTKWDGSARVRGGWLVTPSTMVYFTTGLAWASFQATSTCSRVPTANVRNCALGNYFGGTLGPGVITDSATKIGWTAGVGADLLLTSQWMLRAQYRFSDFGYLLGSGASFTDTRVCTGCPSVASPLTVSSELRVTQHVFEAGVAYKFWQ